ncbi:cell wall metabolism sensor histidine kinase WalK [Parabacteroides sp. Marseille-P3160]|uniref:sensor histidine kinase n=1 Tax=Parabacteroides sp. Marseille-P3160 TaxID=1917887 RepID=UPI0009B9C1E2|nr:HAMP domain-containing sensor histidine kinase [Parabacteroides sp. Marseille-P3160]
MKVGYIKNITLVALISVLALQAIWLYNTYALFQKEFNEKLDVIFRESIEKEIYYRLNDPLRKPTGGVVEGAKPEYDSYTNALAFNKYLEKTGSPFSISYIDTIFKKELTNRIGKLDYLLIHKDGQGKVITQSGNSKDNHLLSNSIYLMRPLNTDHADNIELYVSSPYRIIFGRMFLLLIASAIIALVIIYCLYWQMKIIARQDRIAEIRRDFTNAMIHDMKNPIMTIQMGISALKGGKLDDKELMKQQYFDIVSKESEHLLSLANKVLAIAKFEEKRITLSKQKVDPKLMFEGIAGKYRVNTDKQLEFDLDFEGLPSIYADPEYIYEAFSNVIDNAVKYSGKEVKIRVVGSYDENGNSIIRIRDNGFGISLKDQKRIFEKFERAGLNKKNSGISGFGLGLNYVYQTVTAHRGIVKVDSVLNEYSEFTIILPDKENDKTTPD